ncbi:MAG: hypothetical protein Kow0062_00800 [Acidobacteriota bacterium]
MRTSILCVSGLLLVSPAVPSLALTELSGTLMREEDGTALAGHTVGVTRWSVAHGTAAQAAIPVEWTATSDDLGVYRLDLDESLPGMDRLLVFTSDARVFGELYPGVDLRGVDPKGADIREPAVVTVDLTAGPQTGIDLVVARAERREMVPMGDGVRLDTRIHLPSRRPGLSWPVLLHRTPYALFGANSEYLRHDFAVVLQNTRGRFDSEGEDLVFDADGWLEHQDGYDTVKWIADQPFCEGCRICAYGKSAPGITGYLLAGTAPEELACVWAEVAGGNLYHDYYYPGGEFRKHMIETWLTDNGSLHKLDEILSHPDEDDYWRQRNLLERLDIVTVPILHYAGWYDIVSQGTLNVFKGLQEGVTPGARRNQKLVIGPWTHDDYTSTTRGQLRYPDNSVFQDAQQLGLDWFEFWLKGVDSGILDTPPVRAYVMGPGVGTGAPAGNFWRTSVSWPPPATETAYYLHPGGLLSTAPPTEAVAETSWVADPANPVPTHGGSNLYDDYGKGPLDQEAIDTRADVVVWESAPLLEPLEISGPIRLILHASSDALDADWSVRLEDVYSNGRPMLVTDLILKARHRIGFDREDLLSPGQIHEFEIRLWDTSLVFGVLHRIRIAIAASNYPRFESNPQTGEPFNQHTGTIVATHRVHHDVPHPSRLLLPVVDTDAVTGCAATSHVTGLRMEKLGGDTVRLSWDPGDDPCHRQYRVFAGTAGPQWPWIVRRPLAETAATEIELTDPGVFWQVVSEGTDGGNGPHGAP